MPHSARQPKCLVVSLLGCLSLWAACAVVAKGQELDAQTSNSAAAYSIFDRGLSVPGEWGTAVWVPNQYQDFVFLGLGPENALNDGISFLAWVPTAPLGFSESGEIFDAEAAGTSQTFGPEFAPSYRSIDFEIFEGDARQGELLDHPSVGSILRSKLMPRRDLPSRLLGLMAEDQQHFYSGKSMAQWGTFIVIAGVMANTHADQGTIDPLHENLVDIHTDEYANFLHEHRYLGNGFLLLPTYAGLAFIGKGIGEKPLMPVVGEWSERTLRGMVVGAVPLLLTQQLTGGSRPGETNHGSHWQPFRDNNGVSGHAFVGAMPLLTAAHMTDRIWLKAIFCTASTLPGLSRLTDGAHYPSQVLLGWSLAYVASSAVQQTSHDRVQVQPWLDSQNSGISFSTSW